MRSRSDFGWLFSRLAPMRWRMALGLACVLLSGLVGTLDPLLMRSLIDHALPARNVHFALALVAGIGVCYFGRSALSSAGSLVNFSISQRCIRELRIDLLEQMNRLSEDYHQQTPTGEKLARMEHDVDEIANLGADTANQSIRALLFFTLNLAIMAKLNLIMTVTILPLLPLFAFVQRRFRAQLRQRAEVARTEVGVAASLLNEHLSAVPQIQLLGAEAITTHRVVSTWEEMLRAQWMQRRTQISYSLSMSAILVLAIASVLAAGSFKVLHGALTIGGLVAFYAYVTRVFEPISSAMELYARMQAVGASVRRVREVLELEPSVLDTGTQTLDPRSLRYGYHLREIGFAYGAKPVLHHLTLDIKAGEKIALIGASGSGKSTFARLLVRAADPDCGEILLEARPLVQYTLSSLRSTVCYLPQRPVLFGGTVRENLLYADAFATEDQLHRAIAVSQFASVLTRLPLGLDTPLGPQGASLSGGEQQRLALARSLLRNSDVLILDEATSALDALTESAVLSALVKEYRERTMILISHRIRSLSWVDHFILMDAGSVAGIGTHQELYTASSLYRSLFDSSVEEEQFGARKIHLL